MGLTGPNFDSVDDNLAANLRLRREAAGLSQEEVAERMTQLGCGFSQATIWKIEQGKRPVKLSEAVALGEALGLLRWTSLLDHPDQGKHSAQLEARHRAAAAAYRAVQEATKAYLWEQAQLASAVYDATKAGVAVHQLWTSSLSEPPERAVISARIAFEREDQHHMDIAEETEKVITALRDNGYEPVLNPDDIVEFGPELRDESVPPSA